VTPIPVVRARRRVAQANDCLAEAQLLASNHHWRGAINRLYYAAFYAAKALLALRDLETSKHSATIALFQQQFVKTGSVPADVAKALTRAFDKRQRTDYAELADPGLDDVEAIEPSVRTFVAYCERFVNQQTNSTA
jgi:uncharacterized protein (UPF0332 family)